MHEQRLSWLNNFIKAMRDRSSAPYIDSSCVQSESFTYPLFVSESPVTNAATDPQK